VNQIIGTILMIAGIILGLYIGLYLCFIGGIMGLITEIRAEELNNIKIIINIAKIIFAGTLGTLIFYFLAILGHKFYNK